MEYTGSSHGEMRFRYASVGSGPPVVLLHGFPDHPDSWGDTADALAAEGYRALVPFLRGYHPDTIVAGRDYRSDNTGDDVWRFLDSVDVNQAVLVGHDWGASSAYAAYRQHPERCLALVPIAIPHPASLRPSPATAAAARHFAYFKLPASDRRASRDDFHYIRSLYRRWAPEWTGPEREATIERAIEAFGDRTVFHHVLQWYRDLQVTPDPRNDFRLHCPGLVVAGSEDFHIPRAAWDASCRRFDPGAELLWVEGAGHWPHRIAGNEFHTALLTLLDSAVESGH